MTYAILQIEQAIPFDGDIIPGMNRRVVFGIRYSLHLQRTGFFHDPNGFVVGGMISRALAGASL
jgi:hypothetical protein